jgi:urease accessory protein
MEWGARIRMPIDPALLTLTQWFSPSYPVGAFSYSHGLEWAVEVGDVTDADEFRHWLTDILTYGAGRNDAILLVAGYHVDTPADWNMVNDLACALAPSKERLMETQLQGQAFAKTTSDIWPVGLPELTYPVAIGVAARAMNLPLEQTLALYLQAFASNLTSAAMRLVPLGQTEGQRVLTAMATICAEIAETAQSQTIDELGACSFLADIASMKHETQYTRLFRT